MQTEIYINHNKTEEIGQYSFINPKFKNKTKSKNKKSTKWSIHQRILISPSKIRKPHAPNMATMQNKAYK